MGFGKIFSESWEDYKRNFKSIVLIMLVYLLGTLAFAGISIFSELDSAISFIYIIFLAVFGFLAYIFATGMLVNASVKHKKFSFEQAFKDMKKRYWGYLLFNVVFGIFLIGLFLLLIVPGIIFSVYWCVSSYVFFAEKKGIIASLKRSFNLVKGRWWKVLGYSLLFFLIYFAIWIPFGIVAGVFELLHAELIAQVIDNASFFVTIPLSVLFYKNLYLALKTKKF
ncbi:hypothetical protein COU60_01655 [Candidatus Pacearchaeota archaeon CG10_big_fil_rev_8_21_14_0_10_34_76]|nr:MAG: hypothetical protein COU60_01655 [Candidatus Pacearchaeota archaeon CG10_big_fil_rev_8_21_14_0_10_34_76]